MNSGWDASDEDRILREHGYKEHPCRSKASQRIVMHLVSRKICIDTFEIQEDSFDNHIEIFCIFQTFD